MGTIFDVEFVSIYGSKWKQLKINYSYYHALAWKIKPLLYSHVYVFMRSVDNTKKKKQWRQYYSFKSIIVDTHLRENAL